MNLKCLFGFHEWVKFMGWSNIGDGKFKQTYKCENCKSYKDVIS